MTPFRGLAIVAAATLIAGCAAPPAVVRPTEPSAPAVVAPPPRPPAMVESPPIEPVVRSTAPPGGSEAGLGDALKSAAPAPEAEPAVAPPPSAPAEPTDEQQLAALLGDLQRYGTLGPDEFRRELANVTQLSTRQRNDYVRVRLAVLYTLARTPQDDQRALQLFETVMKSNPGPAAVKQLAGVLHAQVAERARAVRDEQQKADAAIKKLEALRTMERDLLRDRIRGGGGGGGGGGSSGGSGGGGGGGGGG